MEPVNSAVVQTPPVQPHMLMGQTQCRGGRCVLALLMVLFLGFIGYFAVAAYRAPQTPLDLGDAFNIYFLLVLLLACVVKLEQLRVRGDPAAQRVRTVVWLCSAMLANTFALRVAGAMPLLALKLAVWAVATVVLGIAYYYLFCIKGAECCDVEHGRVQADVGRLSPEDKV